jgi:alkylation response protein AidB-like acyl-CoA dehydrogenase
MSARLDIARTRSSSVATALLEATGRAAVWADGHAAQIEAAGRLPRPLLEMLTDAGVFRMLLPETHGGLEVSLVEGMDVIECLAAADASTAWNAMIGAGFAHFWMRFPDAVRAEVFAGGPDTLARGALTPKGSAVPVDGGYRVTGQIPLASGSYDYEWVFATCVVTDRAGPRFDAKGRPDMRVVLLPAAEVEFVDTWDALGLRATCSDDIAFDGSFVPAERAIPFFGEAMSGPPIGRIPGFVALAGNHCAVMTGVTAGILGDLAELLHQRRPVFNPLIEMADDDGTRERFGHLQLRLDAVRTLIRDATAAVWGQAVASRPIDAHTTARYRAIVAFVHNECVATGEDAFRMGGSNVLYRSSSLQRRWRDLHTAGQHFIANNEIYRAHGGLQLGADPEGFPFL